MQKTIKSARPTLETLENRLVPATLAFEVDSVVKTTPVDVQTHQVLRGGITVETGKVVTNTEYFHGDYSFTSDENGYGRNVQTRENTVVDSESWTRIQYPNGSGAYYSVTVQQDVGSTNGNSFDVSIDGSHEINHVSSYTSYSVSTYSSRWDGRGNSTSISTFSRHYVSEYSGDYEYLSAYGSTYSGENQGGSVQDVSETRYICGFADGSVRQSMTGSSKIRFDYNSSYSNEYADGSWSVGASKRTDTSVGRSTEQSTLIKGTFTQVSLNYVIGNITKHESFAMFMADDQSFQSHTVQQNISEDWLTRRTLITAPSGVTIDIQSSIVSVFGQTKVNTVDMDATGTVFRGTGLQTFTLRTAVQDTSVANASGQVTYHSHNVIVTPKVTTKTSVSGVVTPANKDLALRAKDHVLSLYGSPLDQYTEGLSNAIFA